MRRVPRDEPWEGGEHVPWHLGETILGNSVQTSPGMLSCLWREHVHEPSGRTVLQGRSPRAETSALVLWDSVAGSLGELCQAQGSSMTLLLGSIPDSLYCYLALEIHNGESLMFSPSKSS